MSQFKSDLGDLTHGHSWGTEARGVVEFGVSLESFPHEVLKGVNILLIKHVLQLIQNDKTLLMRDGTEVVGLHEVKDCFNYFAS